MERDIPEHDENKKPAEQLARQTLADEALNQPPAKITLSSSELLSTGKSEGLSVDLRKGIANFVGTASASLTGTIAWSVADKAVGNTGYGMAAKVAAAFVAGGLTRYATKGGTELALLDAKDRTTGLSDLAWGGVDALAAVGAVKAEEAFSNRWKANLGLSSGTHLSQELLQEQGGKILAGNLEQRIIHNTLRGAVGGATGALLWTSPHEIVNNFDKLNTLAGWKKTTDDIATSTLFGTAFGGALMGTGTALWNAREIAGITKAATLGTQGRYALDVYHFNDGHSSVLGKRATLPQLAGKAEELVAASKKEGVSSLVLDLGDAHSGNAAAIVSNTGKLEQQIIHQNLQVDASIPGNHSADTGLYSGVTKDVPQWIRNMTEINQNLRASGREVPGLAANVQSVADPSFINAETGIYKPYKIFVDPKSGDKVGLVGLVTDQLQNATPKLLDADLAVAAAKYGNLSWKAAVEKLGADPASKSLMDKLATNAALQKLVEANPETKLSTLVDQVISETSLKGLSPAAAQNWRGWFALAGEHPQAKLSELSAQIAGNKPMMEVAALYSDKRIADLHQVMVSDPLIALQDSVNALKQQGVNKVVVMSHLGEAEDLRLAKQGPLVAAYFGGHSHDLEPVPLFVKNRASGSDVLVTQAGHGYGWLGGTKIVFNENGSANRFFSSGKMHVIDETVSPLKSAQDAVNNHMESSPEGRALLQQVGQHHPVQVKTEISLENIRGQKGIQTPLANLIVSAFKEGGDKSLPALNALRASQGLPPLGESVDAVLIQSGGIRSGLPAGAVDELTLQTMFMNRPSIVEMSGAEIQKTLSYGVHDFPSVTKPEGFLGKTKEMLLPFTRDHSPLADFDASGKNVIAGQLRFNVDRTLPTFDRASAVEIWNEAAGKYVPIDPAKRYTVMTVNHLLGRIGNTPLIPAAQLRGASLDDLGPEYWALGRRVEPSEVNSLMKPSELSDSSSRDFVLDYLKSHSKEGVFSLAPNLLASPMKDVSPGIWVPRTRPSINAAVSLGAVSAFPPKTNSN